MARNLYAQNSSILASLHSQKHSSSSIPASASFAGIDVQQRLIDSSSSVIFRANRRSLVNVSATRCSGPGYECTGSLNAPLDPASVAGKTLTGVLQNDPSSFYDTVSKELNALAEDRYAAFTRMDRSRDSPEASLHRRISELKGEECKNVAQDIMYMMICYRFSEMRVPLVPCLDKCMYSGRLEILPSKDFELEAIHSSDVLEMVREYLTTVLGWKSESSVAVNWSPTKVKKRSLSQVYSASIMYGYFLKSASLRHRLERHISEPYLDMIPLENWAYIFGSGYYGLRSIALGEFNTPSSTTSLSQMLRPKWKKDTKPNVGKLGSYVQGFDAEMLRSCAEVRSLEAVDLVEKHCLALFGDDENNSCFMDGGGGLIVTSLASLKRLVLEAIAFGCFLWDTEEYVDRLYKLKDAAVLERSV